MLPVLGSLLKSAIDSKDRVLEIDQQFQDLSHKIFLSGGIQVDVPKMSKLRSERDKAIQVAKDSLAEIDSTGVQVKDLDTGLLDFPCLVDEKIILLCWKLGEETISHWHGTDEGFSKRKPITETMKSRKPEKPN